MGLLRKLTNRFLSFFSGMNARGWITIRRDEDELVEVLVEVEVGGDLTPYRGKIAGFVKEANLPPGTILVAPDGELGVPDTYDPILTQQVRNFLVNECPAAFT